MEVFLANPRGFCAGVDRAIDIVERLRGWGGQVPNEVVGREERVYFALPRELRRAVVETAQK